MADRLPTLISSALIALALHLQTPEMVWSHKALKRMDCQGVNPRRHQRPNSKRSTKKDLGGSHPQQLPGVQSRPSSSPGQIEIEGNLERHCCHATSHLPLGGFTDVKPDMMNYLSTLPQRVKTTENCSFYMSSKLSVKTEIAFLIDEYKLCNVIFKIENVQSNMISKLECFSGPLSHIASGQHGLAWLFQVWTILCAQL